MPALMLQCSNCGRIFSSGISIGTGATVHLSGNLSQCQYCGSIENIPDGTFRSTVEGFIRVIQESDNPLQEAKTIFEAFEKSR